MKCYGKGYSILKGSSITSSLIPLKYYSFPYVHGVIWFDAQMTLHIPPSTLHSNACAKQTITLPVYVLM